MILLSYNWADKPLMCPPPAPHLPVKPPFCAPTIMKLTSAEQSKMVIRTDSNASVTPDWGRSQTNAYALDGNSLDTVKRDKATSNSEEERKDAAGSNTRCLPQGDTAIIPLRKHTGTEALRTLSVPEGTLGSQIALLTRSRRPTPMEALGKIK